MKHLDTIWGTVLAAFFTLFVMLAALCVLAGEGKAAAAKFLDLVEGE